MACGNVLRAKMTGLLAYAYSTSPITDIRIFVVFKESEDGKVNEANYKSRQALPALPALPALQITAKRSLIILAPSQLRHSSVTAPLAHGMETSPTREPTLVRSSRSSTRALWNLWTDWQMWQNYKFYTGSIRFPHIARPSFQKFSRFNRDASATWKFVMAHHQRTSCSWLLVAFACLEECRVMKV